MKRTAQLYLLIVSIAGLGIFFILHAGSELPSAASPLSVKSAAQVSPHVTEIGGSFFASVKSSLQQNGTNPLSRLLLQLFVIISVCCIAGWAFSCCANPAVVGRWVAVVVCV